MAHLGKRSRSKRKLAFLYFYIAILLSLICSSCNEQNTLAPQVVDTGENLDSLDSDDGVYIQFDAPSEIFSISNAHHTTPEDVLREVGEYPFDAGGEENFCEMYEFNSPTIVLAGNFLGEQELEWRESWRFVSCGWRADEKVRLLIKNEVGEEIFRMENTDANGEIFSCDDDTSLFPCFPDLNTPLGKYAISLEGETADLSFDLFVVKPTGPRVYEYKDKLILYNFRPNEEVRLLCYSNNSFDDKWIFSLDAWSEFQVQSDGQLILEVNNEPSACRYVVIGDMSGEVKIFSSLSTGSIFSVTLSPYENLSVFRPTNEDLGRLKSMWDFVGYQDLKRPGKQVYQTTIQAEDEFRWGFSWCATDADTLAKILYPFTIEFIIDGISLSEHDRCWPQVQIERERPNSRGWICTRWSTLLTNWKPNSQVELEVKYSLSDSIFDGQETYPAGEYRQIIHVNVKE